jgi:hypothetical protein
MGIDTDLNNEVEQASLKSAAIVYNSGTGNLFYNENGSDSGLGNGGKFATIDGAIALSNDDFSIVF